MAVGGSRDWLGLRLSESDEEGVMRSLVLRAGERRVQYLVLTGCLILGVLGLGAVDAQAATPSSLAGETFTSHHVRGSTLTGTCNGQGGVSASP
jgi:hypothetical protein